MGQMPSSGPTQFEQFVSKLKLDEKTQVPEVQQIFMGAAADASVFEREMMRQRLKMLEVAGNQEEFAKATEAYSAAAAKMTAVEVRAFDEVRGLLKSNQLSHTVDAFAIMAGIFHPPTPRAGSGMGRRGRGGE
jgi:hypothetical protein